MGWIRPVAFYALAIAIGLTVTFTLTPGLGGIFLLLGVWFFLRFRDRSRLGAVASLGIGGSLALAAVLAAAVTPIIHPTAPFLIEVPGFGIILAPSVRMMTWMAAASSFSQHPLVGAGLGSQVIAVKYIAPSGIGHVLTDAHNVFLNVAMHCGLVGLIPMALLMTGVWRLTLPLRLAGNDILRVGLGLAWLNAFAYQGLTGSYEDARHLWVLLGLLLAGSRLKTRHDPDQSGPVPATAPQDP